MPHERDEEMRAHLETWKVSDLTQIDYCQQNNIKPHIFTYYKTKLGYGQTQSNTNRLLPVQVVTEQSLPCDITIKLSGDVSIQVTPGFDRNTLQQVLSLLR